MAKKRLSGASTSPKKEAVVEDAGPQALNQIDANLLQQLVQVSNQYGKLYQQKSEFETILKQVQARRADIASGKIKLPILMALGKNKLYSCDDMKAVLEDLDAEIRVISNGLKGIEGQIMNYRDAYIEAGLKVNDFLDTRFGKYKPTVPYTKGCTPTKKEKVIFEEELETILKSAEKQEKLAAAIETAKQENAKK